MSKRLKITIIAFSVIILLVLSAFITLIALSYGTELDEAKLKPNQNIINVFDITGETVKKTEQYLTIDKIPDNLKDAFVALEDKRFYEHNGIDAKRIASALWTDIKTLSLKEGGSTITQQLIKNTHLDGNKNFRRKLKEARLALEIEKKFSKDEILEMYLNVIYLGGGIYGVKEGASRFFDKECSNLTLAECASIAGTTKNPSRYSPTKNLENNKSRAKTVLDCMLDQKKITQNEYDNAMQELQTISIADTKEKTVDIYSNYVSNAYAQASDILKMSVSEIKEKGYKLFTYLDSNAQKEVYLSATNSNLNAASKNGTADKTAILCDNASRGIIAYYSDNYNQLFYQRRQIGSVIKPFYSYAPAIEENIFKTTDILNDEAGNFDGYKPSNYADIYRGKITLKQALATSSNVCAVQLAYLLGEKMCFNYAKAFGLNLDKKDENLSAALGGLTYGVSPADVATAYCALSNGGTVKSISFVKTIEDANGKVVYSHSDIAEKKAISKQSAYLLSDMLKYTAKEGTAKKMGVLPFSVYSKTGTVSHADKNFNSDAWNASYTSKHTIISLYSADSDDMLLQQVSGGSYPTLLSKTVFERLYNRIGLPEDIEMPNDIIKVDLVKSDLEQGKITKANAITDPFNITTEYFKNEFAPFELYTAADIPRITNWNIKRIDGIDTIEFDTLKGFGYKIIRETLFGKEIVLYDGIAQSDIRQVVEMPNEGALSLYRYVLRPYKQIGDKQICGVDEISRLITIFG